MLWCACGAPLDDLSPSTVQVGSYELESNAFGRGLRRGKEILELSPQEATVLSLLARRKMVSIEVLTYVVSPESETHVVTQVVCRLRKKLASFTTELRIQTLRPSGGQGVKAFYRLEKDPPETAPELA